MSPMLELQIPKSALDVLASLSYRNGDLQTYLNAVAQGVRDLVGLDWSVVTLCENGSEQILASTVDLGDAAKQIYDLHGTLTGAVVEQQCPLVVEDTRITTQHGAAPDGYLAYLGVPLRSPSGKVIGTICSFQTQARQFTPDEVRLAEIFAERAATAIDNYQLYQQQQRTNEALVKANQELQRSIDQHRHTEAALRTSETRLQKIFNASNDAIFVIDPKSDRILEVNPRASDLLGYSREQLLRSVHISDVHPEEMPQLLAFTETVLTEGSGWTDELTCLTQSGDRLPAEISAAAIEFLGHNCVLALVRNITERKQAEAALRDSETRFRQLAENMHQIFWMYSSQGEPLYVSPAFERIWGVECDCWYKNPHAWRDRIHPDDQERVCRAYAADMLKFNEEYRIIDHQGTVRIIRDQAFPIYDDNGVIYRIAGIAEDVTERRQQQQDIMRAMERLAEIGELAAMIVHEVRNPLTTVLMGLNSFKLLDLPERSLMRLDLALDEAERLKRLLNEILLYAKQQSLNTCEVELNDVIQALLVPIRALPCAQQREIHFQPTPHPVMVQADEDKLKQVLINLVMNACEAIAEGDTVTWSLNCEHSPGAVCIIVHNGGLPIPADVLPKLTKPFFTTKRTGNGLGLAIVKRIVEAHQGYMTITSSAEAGTHVTVTLPLSANTI